MGEDSAPAQRTPARRKARQLARHLRGERPDYAYLKEVFRHLRDELGVEVATTAKKLPYVPAEEEIRRYYQTVWTARRSGDIVLIKTLLYTGVRVAELVAIRLTDADLDACRIRITNGKGGKDRYVPFPGPFRETLALHIAAARANGAVFLFESSWKKPYSTRGVRARLARYAAKRPGPQHATPPAPALPVHLAQNPGHRRCPHPALLRPRLPHLAGDLQPPRPARRPGQLRRRHRPIPRVDRHHAQPTGPRKLLAGYLALPDTSLTGTPRGAAGTSRSQVRRGTSRNFHAGTASRGDTGGSLGYPPGQSHGA
jgi:integrase/recombinase XerD